MARPLPRRPCYRSIIGFDAEGSTRRTDPGRGHLRDAMFGMFDQALAAADITESRRDEYLDRGDGALALVHPRDEVPKTAFLDTVVPKFVDLLAEHNANHPDQAFRLRAVVSAGEVTYDERGVFGEALDVAFRLLDASTVKRMLVATDAPMVLVVSDEIHRSVVRQGYEGIDPTTYTRLRARTVSGLPRVGWARTVSPPRALGQLVGVGTVSSLADHRRQA